MVNLTLVRLGHETFDAVNSSAFEAVKFIRLHSVLRTHCLVVDRKRSIVSPSVLLPRVVLSVELFITSNTEISIIVMTVSDLLFLFVANFTSDYFLVTSKQNPSEVY
jgi:hypothetical protein